MNLSKNSITCNKIWVYSYLVLVITACGNEQKTQQVKLSTKATVLINKDPYPSTYQAAKAPPVAIFNATLLTGNGEQIDQGVILMQNGIIEIVGKIDAFDDHVAQENIVQINGSGKWVTPGIIDVHSHLGVSPSPKITTLSDANESSHPVTAEVWAEHSVWPQDPGFSKALAGGITSMQILPGSANLFGGRGVTLKNIPARTVQGMKFPNAPYGLKMACGENPIRIYGRRKKVAPTTRMGNMAGYRIAWSKAVEYKRKWDAYHEKMRLGWQDSRGGQAKPPKRDLQMETLVGVLEGDILVHNHCYRADEMAVMMDLAKEFGYKVTAFHHAVESYKIADLLADQQVCSAMWADWWGFKLEAYDGIRQNVALVEQAGACAIIHSDSSSGIQRLNQEAAKAMGAAHQANIAIDPAKAITWITANPAKALGIDQYTGSLTKGKMADIVLWNGDPFSVYSKAEQVYIDGVLVYDLNNPQYQPLSDFELGQSHRLRARPAQRTTP